jgi:hypothetical protein
MENFAALVLIFKVFYYFEVKFFNSLKWAAKSTSASSLFSIESSKQGFFFQFCDIKNLAKLSKKN